MKKLLLAAIFLALGELGMFCQQKSDLNALAQEMVDKINRDQKLTAAQQARLKVAAKLLISSNMNSEQDLKQEKGYKSRLKAWTQYKATLDSLTTNSQNSKIDSIYSVNK